MNFLGFREKKIFDTPYKDEMEPLKRRTQTHGAKEICRETGRNPVKGGDMRLVSVSPSRGVPLRCRNLCPG